MEKFIYDEIYRRQGIFDVEYTCGGKRGYSLFDILKEIGNEGWELVGEIEGRLVIKKKLWVDEYEKTN